jgi:S1-C subfamily serine protease
MFKQYLWMVVFFICLLSHKGLASDVSSYLQDISVTIKTSRGEGSGVVFTRDIVTDEGNKKINFVWTAAHVLENIRNVKTVLGPEGNLKKIVEFQDAEIIKKLVENGRTVGQLVMDAKVVKYSDAKDGEDLALLMIRKFNFVESSAKFSEDKENKGVPLGTQLYHVGSLLGSEGSNSMTTGIMSQVGRTISLNGGPKILFDQTTVTAFPGSSGGGVFLTSGEYIGMLVRGAGETFNLIVPMRRISKWAKAEEIEWALNQSIKAPTLQQIEKLPIEKLGTVETPSNSLILP